MDFEKFKEHFHESWHAKIKPFIESNECDAIYKYLKSESQRGKKIAPLSQHVYRCFFETPLTDVKLVILDILPSFSIASFLVLALISKVPIYVPFISCESSNANIFI